ncbi:hypothetical protein FNH22_03525 [Fulvivirga sp. M361]|uniref:hypothetical protein n=1 Tax=Fulvivirga sp. M361 TaxID=2594266 RepID=UPI00117B6E38|nr:hypothetical protein [Fulvivirga sp. M361]TRX61858.1 hypothetical protein FNH22_03525 [Fulvivirga sp. M361]
MKSKAFFLCTFCLIGSSIVSCLHETCDPAPPHFEIKGITSSNRRFTNSVRGPSVTFEDNLPVNWSSFLTRFEFEVNYIAKARTGLNGTLMALSCLGPGEAGDKIGVDTVIVRTTNDYNKDYLKGAVINDIILANDWIFHTDDFDQFIPLADYIMNNSEGVLWHTFELKLTEPPARDTEFSFELTYKLNNGDEFTHTTRSVNLTE